MPKESGFQLVDGILTPIWTKDPPTGPGLYWFQLRTGDKPVGVIRHCRVVQFERRLLLHTGEGPMSERHTVDHLQRWWAGPLLEPTEEE